MITHVCVALHFAVIPFVITTIVLLVLQPKLYNIDSDNFVSVVVEQKQITFYTREREEGEKEPSCAVMCTKWREMKSAKSEWEK